MRRHFRAEHTYSDMHFRARGRGQTRGILYIHLDHDRVDGEKATTLYLRAVYSAMQCNLCNTKIGRRPQREGSPKGPMGVTDKVHTPLYSVCMYPRYFRLHNLRHGKFRARLGRKLSHVRTHGEPLFQPAGTNRHDLTGHVSAD